MKDFVSKSYERKRIYKSVLITILMTATVMTLYEWVKQLVRPNITIWQSHTVTIIFSTLVAAFATFFALRRYTSLKQQTEEEAALRRSVEQSRDELLSKTEELVRITKELESEIHKHKETADVLRQSRHFNEKVLNNTPNMIYIYEIDSSRIVYTNKQFAAFTGLSDGQIGNQSRSMPIDMLLLREDQKNSSDLVDQLRMGPAGTVVEREIRISNRQQESRWVRVRETPFSWTDKGELNLVLSIAQDVTEERNSRNERDRLAAAIDGIAEGILVMSGDGHIQYANHAACAMTGKARDRVTGSDIRNLPVRKGVPFAVVKWDELIRAGKPWSGRVRLEENKGTLSEIEVTLSPIHDRSGSIMNYVAIGRDVSEEAKLEIQLRRAQKMEAIATLSGGIAHDFNNMLTAVLGFADLALTDSALSQSTRHFLEQVTRAGMRGRDLVRQILALSRHTEEEHRPLAIKPIVKESIRLLRATLPSSVEMVERISPENLAVKGDASQIQQVLMNLCTNAAHAMRDQGGTLEISLNRVWFEHDGQVHRDLCKGSYVRLSVTDSGTGIPPEILERIFDPFFTTKRPGEGTGLGLSVVHGIMRSHGGAITVKSELGEGSVFEAYWPIVDSEADSEKQPVEVPIPSGNERILLVDDEPAIVEMAETTMKQLGYTVVSTTSSARALEIFLNDPEGFDLVVTDQTMPHLTGVDLVRQILAAHPETPIILMTGFSETIDAEQAKGLGISEYLMKPLGKYETGNALRRALDNRRARGGLKLSPRPR